MANENVFLRYFKNMKGRWVLLLLFAFGITLLLLGRGGGEESAVSERDYFAAAEEYRAALEAELCELCSSIEGVGAVSVTVTLENGEECVYAKNESTGSYVTSSGEGLLLYKRLPTVRGVAVVCEGGDRDDVRLSVTEAVSTACGIGANKISISKKSS